MRFIRFSFQFLVFQGKPDGQFNLARHTHTHRHTNTKDNLYVSAVHSETQCSLRVRFLIDRAIVYYRSHSLFARVTHCAPQTSSHCTFSLL